MTRLLLFSLVVGLTGVTDTHAQTPSTPTVPAQPRTQAPARTAQPAARSGMAITAIDPKGATIPGVSVDLTGPTPRNGVTNASGQINFPGLQAGTYRVRFSGDAVIAFEREVSVRAGQVADLDIVLNPAPTPAHVDAPPPPPPPPAQLGPAGRPQVVSIVNLVERDLVSGNAPRKDTLVACSGNTRTMLVQLNQPQPTRVYEGAESVYYVVAGEGTVVIDDRDVALEAGGYVSVPRGTAHSLTRRGRRPLILLAILSGEPCEEAR